MVIFHSKLLRFTLYIVYQVNPWGPLDPEAVFCKAPAAQHGTRSGDARSMAMGGECFIVNNHSNDNNDHNKSY